MNKNAESAIIFVNFMLRCAGRQTGNFRVSWLIRFFIVAPIFLCAVGTAAQFRFDSWFNPNQANFDLDGIGDVCDPQTGPPRNKEQCKNGGWMRFDFPRRFRNQGDCIQFVNTGR